MIDLDAAAYGTHSLRRSKVALVYLGGFRAGPFRSGRSPERSDREGDDAQSEKNWGPALGAVKRNQESMEVFAFGRPPSAAGLVEPMGGERRRSVAGEVGGL